MATVRYSQQINGAALRAVLSSRNGGLARDLIRRGLLVETQAKRNLAGGDTGPKRIDTGRLRASITTALVTRDGELAVIIGTNVRYAVFVHGGTGIYGPNRRPIRPRSARMLSWVNRKTGRRIYAFQVAGMKPNYFLRGALRAAGRH